MNRTCLCSLMLTIVFSGCGSDETTPTDIVAGPDTVSSADGQTTDLDTAEEIDTTSHEDAASEPDNPCVPECGAKACGDDGCGGSCGDCDDGLACNVAGQCDCPEGQVAECDPSLFAPWMAGPTVEVVCVAASSLGDGTCDINLSCHGGDGGDCCPGQVHPQWVEGCFGGWESCEFPEDATVPGCDGTTCLPLATWGDGQCHAGFDCESSMYDNQDCKTYCTGSPNGGTDIDQDGLGEGLCVLQCGLEGKDPFGCWIDEGSCSPVIDAHLGECIDGEVASCGGLQACPEGDSCAYDDSELPGHEHAVCVGTCGDGICGGYEWQGGGVGMFATAPCHEDCNPCAAPDDPTYIEDADWSADCAGECAKTAALVGNGTCDESLNCVEHGYDGGDCEPPVLDVEDQIQALLVDDLGLDQLTISLDVTEIEAQAAAYPGPVAFMTALDQAMTSFLTDDDDIESPLGIATFVAEATWDPDNPEGQTFAEATLAALLDHLNRPTASISLVPIGQTAEHGESVVDNWVFFLTIDELSDHLYWAIVDRQGVNATYNYGFN